MVLAHESRLSLYGSLNMKLLHVSIVMRSIDVNAVSRQWTSRNAILGMPGGVSDAEMLVPNQAKVQYDT
jgi:hypothetical protein